MKSILALLIILGFILSVRAQSVKKKIKRVGDYKEMYYVDRSTKLRHGYYTKTHTETGIKSVSGEFMKGMRYGVWKFKDTHTENVILEYDFSNSQLIYLDRKQYPDSFIVRTNNTYEFTKVDRPLIFIGYLNEEEQILESILRIPKNVKNAGIRGQCTIAFFVDKNGYISESQIITAMGNKFENEIHNKVLKFYDRFLPAIKDGEPVESVFYVNVNIHQKNDMISYDTISAPYFNEVFLTYYLPDVKPQVFLFPTVHLPFGRGYK